MSVLTSTRPASRPVLRAPRWRAAVVTALTTPLLAAFIGLASPAHAATAAPPTPQSMMEALTRANAAVVRVQVTATEGARSIDTLGRERRGSGVVIGDDGLILTIGYLLLEADTVEVQTQDLRTVPARAVAYDGVTGFGLVRPLLPLRVKPVSLGSVGSVREGEVLMAATGGEGGDVTMTQVVSRRPFSGYWEYHIDQSLITSPPIEQHSGAPVFSTRGELLGIGSLFMGQALEGRRVPGTLFVPVDLLKPRLAELLATGTTRDSRRPWLGLTSTEQSGRVQVVRVTPDSPAQGAGLAPGDVVLAVDGQRVASLEGFYKALWAHAQPDDEITLTVLQGADIRQIRLRGIDRRATFKRADGV